MIKKILLITALVGKLAFVAWFAQPVATADDCPTCIPPNCWPTNCPST